MGGRLFGKKDDPVELVRQLDEFLDSGKFVYVVIEPNGLSDGIGGRVEAAGYQSIFANEQGEVFRRGS